MEGKNHQAKSRANQKKTIEKLEHKLTNMKLLREELIKKRLLVKAFKQETDIQEANIDRPGDSVEAGIITAADLRGQKIALQEYGDDLEARNRYLETRVKQLTHLQPLVESGTRTLDRKYEFTKVSKPDKDVLRQGDGVAHFGSAQAEAVLFLGMPSRPPLDDERRAYFVDRYGFSVDDVYSQLNSPTLMAVCNTHYGMYEYKSSTQQEFRLQYQPLFDAFHSRIIEWLSEQGLGEDLLPGEALEAFIQKDSELCRLAAEMHSIAEDAHTKHKDEREMDKARTRKL